MSTNQLILLGTASVLLLGAAVYLVLVLVRSRSIDYPLSSNGRPLRVLIGAGGFFMLLAALASFAGEATDAHPNWKSVVTMFLLAAAMLGLSATSIRLLVVARKLSGK